MKKVLFLMAAVLTFVACSKEEWNLSPNDSNKVSSNNKRSLDEAIQIANKAARVFGKASTRNCNRVVDLNNIKYIKNSSTRNEASNNDTILYVINYADNNGFAVISANKETDALLAVTEKGSYTPLSNENTENEGFNMFMESAKSLSLEKPGLNPTLPDTIVPGGETLTQIRYVYDTTEVRIEPKVTVQWGQTDPEGLLAPNYKAGCANTAMSQILSYFCHPTVLDITYEDAPITSLSLNWEDIKLHKVGHYYDYECTCNPTIYWAIAYLHRELGELNQSTYYQATSTSGATTSTSTSNVRTTFKNLDYTISNEVTYSNESFYTELNDNKLIFMAGTQKETDSSTGEITKAHHAWVVDGYWSYTATTKVYTKPDNALLWTLFEEYSNTKTFMHINWGFSGDCNGYFSKGVFETSSAYEYDRGKNHDTNDNYDYNYNYSLSYFTVTR